MEETAWRKGISLSVCLSAGVYNVIGVTDTAGATIRYTLDGSRPNETSPVLDPEGGINLAWPGPALVVNMRCGKSLF